MSTPTAAPEDVATPSTTRGDFVRVSARGYTVIRNIFVQVWTGDKWVGSSLGRLVEARQPRALRAYLLLLMSWSAIDKRPEPLEAAVWARALSPDAPAPPWAPSAMTRVWNALEEHGLIERKRQGRLLKLAPRREDGKQPYARPRPDQSKSTRELFFILPDTFWTDGWHDKLTLPGVAALLIMLAETTGRDEALLPYDPARQRYGIAPKTLQNGLEDLRRHGLIQERREWVRDSFSKIGKAPRVHYTLTGAFSRPARQKLQKAATRATKKRLTKRNAVVKHHAAKTTTTGA